MTIALFPWRQHPIVASPARMHEVITEWLPFDAAQPKRKRAENVCLYCHSKKIKCDLQVCKPYMLAARLVHRPLMTAQPPTDSGCRPKVHRDVAGARTARRQGRTASCDPRNAQSASIVMATPWGRPTGRSRPRLNVPTTPAMYPTLLSPTWWCTTPESSTQAFVHRISTGRRID